MKETVARKSRFDLIGFATLALAIGAFQMMLDRGQTKDWFNSVEIITEASIAGLALYLFIVHLSTTSERPFLSPSLFADRNFLTGNVFIFVVGVVLFATLALLPPMLQGIMNYPVVLTGLVTAPRGVGTLLAMFVVGRLIRWVDTRWIIAVGFAMTGVSLWEMTHFSTQMSDSSVIWSGLLQGFGTGFVYVPLAALTFATLSPLLRNEGTSVFSLVRNIGSSVGISVVTTLLTRNTQIMHARLGEQITPFGDALMSPGTQSMSSLHGLAGLDAMVTQQATMIAYNNDFKLMMLLTFCAVPLVALLRRAAPAAAKAEDMVME